MLHGPPHGALHVLASVNNGASITDGNSVTPTQVFRSERGRTVTDRPRTPDRTLPLRTKSMRLALPARQHPC